MVPWWVAATALVDGAVVGATAGVLFMAAVIAGARSDPETPR